MRRVLALLVLLLIAPSLLAQWEIEQSNSTASLRGIVSVGGGVAWASGNHGTVLRTEDGGYVWQTCVAPPDSAKLDFRGIQAWDENVAIVMSAGPGELSRLYRTTDGCRTWQLLLTNHDHDGFWDAIQFSDRQHGFLLGDPVQGHFVVLTTADGGATWVPVAMGPGINTTGESIFAASNSSLVVSSPSSFAFCTGGPAGAMIFRQHVGQITGPHKPGEINFGTTASAEELISFSKTASTGCFSLASNHSGNGTLVAVGGDYQHPEQTENTAWTTSSSDDPENKAHPLFTFSPAKTKPSGYRSAVAFDAHSNGWIAVGPGGTDVSHDDGITWTPLKPAVGVPVDTDKHWNALSLPFAVGSDGRIGKLRGDVLRAR